MWDAGETPPLVEQHWVQLSETERQAAAIMGYDASEWDASEEDSGEEEEDTAQEEEEEEQHEEQQQQQEEEEEEEEEAQGNDDSAQAAASARAARVQALSEETEKTSAAGD
jgi:hypothetical protein